eukprot:GILJ01015103.1.p1 GENE.GILJ01015103.1~~GILJ01015103.1.p1  ORF type:complete len:345 (+),score=17.85 GILJ01015103.1:573-1607(+)
MPPPKYPMLTSEQMAVIRYAFHQQKLSKAAISRDLGISRNTVAKALATDEGVVKRKARRQPGLESRRKLLSRLARETKVRNGRRLPRYPSTTALRAALVREGFKVSRATVHRDLAATHDVVVRPLQPFDCDRSKELRRKLKRTHLRTDPSVFIFSDEHFVTTNDHTTRTMWLPKSAPGKKRVLKPIPRVRKSRFNVPSIMIWAAIGVNYRSPLVFLPKQKGEDGQTLGMNSKRYIRCCLTRLVATCPKNRIFMQDGARCHSANHTLDYLDRKGVTVLEDWPPYSPDLNPIENLWYLLDQRLSELVPRTLDELKLATVEAWNAIPIAHINALVRSFQGRLKTKID